MDRKKLNEILDKHVQKFFKKAPAARFDDVPSETFIDAMEEAINYTRCSTQFNALLQKETEVIYKSVKYYIFLIDYNKEVASIKQVEGTWIEYNIPFKELTKSI
jgi:hypothetical protein